MLPRAFNIIRSFVNSAGALSWDNPSPIREELFSIERLEEHARSLAAAQTVIPGRCRGHSLLRRLEYNSDALMTAHRAIAKVADSGGKIIPAAEWLLDNYHFVETSINEMRSGFTADYYHQLPKLSSGPFVRYPRIFGVVWSYIAHNDSYFDADLLVRYLLAYQEEQVLTIGELWAVSTTIRFIMIENLRRLADYIVNDSIVRQEANTLADRILSSDGGTAEAVSCILEGLSKTHMPKSFAAQMVRRLRDQDPQITLALKWLDQRLAAQNSSSEVVVRDELQKQSASNITVRNIITGLRKINEEDWSEIFEDTSPVDRILSKDTIFTKMDFSTRNLYRNAIEELARGSDVTEIDIADRVMSLARIGEDERTRDPGYYLLTGGRHDFERAIGFVPPLRTWHIYLNKAFGIVGYLGVIEVVSAFLLAIPMFFLYKIGVDIVFIVLLAVMGLTQAIDVAISFVNRGASRSFRAIPLPAVEIKDEVPASCRTLLTVPTMLTSLNGVQELVEQLEVHYLSSPKGEIYFSLLSDWADADTQTKDGDDVLLKAAMEGIAVLNRRHGPAPGGVNRFYLFHRMRLWNEGEGKWIGWERKRGKLHEMNMMLRGHSDTTFLDTGFAPPSDVRFVVTLDSDTRLLRDSVSRLIGKMAHPLNRPRLDLSLGRVVEGYAILQPRVTPSLPIDHESSLFQLVFSSIRGIDPYSSAASDVYQDLYGEGSYTGKGIYDIDAFESALVGRIPENAVLSHDLFEGIYSRAGLASDVEVVEEYPDRYDVAALRMHRWVRGDWQLLPWIVAFGKQSIPMVGRWKMVDNLRRSLSAPTAVLGLIIALTQSFHVALVWSLFVVATIFIPPMIPIASVLFPHRKGVTMHSHFRAFFHDLFSALGLVFLNVVFLAHQAWMMSDAIIRSMIRLFITRKNLLEWTTAAQASGGKKLDIPGFYSKMASALFISAIAIIASVLFGHNTWPLAIFFATLWGLSPAIAYRVSQSSPIADHLPVSEVDAKILRLIARRTWRFFETFITAEDNYLPPDNFQEDPVPVVAHRTSPTNIGLYMLSTVAARNFGWIGTVNAVDRLEATFATMSKLARHQGHFYNWYDTKDLRPLEPPYVSSVDSGNLAGHLIAVANACREWRDVPVSNIACMTGIVDSLVMAREEAVRLNDGRVTQTVTWQQLDDSIVFIENSVGDITSPDIDFSHYLAGLSVHADTMVDIARTFCHERGDDSGDDLLYWAESVGRAISDHCFVVDASVKKRLEVLEDTARSMSLAMSFGFLIDQKRKLMSIGYNMSSGTLDPSCYDLIASEARLGSFMAIAKGDVQSSHWFHLGRTTTPVGRSAALVSWSGSMFEYLMPALVMRSPKGSVLEQTNKLVVQRQINYGKQLGVPWGISESAYNVRDLEMTYQYSPAGVPGLGLKRGLANNTVIAPYATALAAMVDPHAAVKNFRRLAKAGGRGRYGYYEALDYTPIRLEEGKSVAVIKAFMAHHQGMSIVALANVLQDGKSRGYFHEEPMVQATELLLHERMPRDVIIPVAQSDEAKTSGTVRVAETMDERRIDSPQYDVPATHLLSNGNYSVMLTSAGSGYSRWKNYAVTRWREDPTCDDWGSYVFIRDVYTGEAWSAGFQPSCVEPDYFQALFNEGRGELIRRDGSLTTKMEVLVSTEGDAEVRHVSFSNSSAYVREIEVTSYLELVLTRPMSDIDHPAFAKLFVETEFVEQPETLLARRRPREASEQEIWAAHIAVVNGKTTSAKVEYETDRARFLGRDNTARSPLAIMSEGMLSGTTGVVLDPIFSLRRRIIIPPGGTASIAFWTAITTSRQGVLDLIDRYRGVTAFERAATLARTHAQAKLFHLGIAPDEANLYQRLASHLIYATPIMRPPSENILHCIGSQSDLWGNGVSGDIPILLLRISDMEALDIARQLIQAHEYWCTKQLAVDLVIINERQSSYIQDLQLALEALVQSSQARSQLLKGGETSNSGRIFVIRKDLLATQNYEFMTSIARVVFVSQRGSLSDQLDRLPAVKAAMPRLPAKIYAKHGSTASGDDAKSASLTGAKQAAIGAELYQSSVAGEEHSSSDPNELELEFFNGVGGFANHGKEYVTLLGPKQSTPTPWINVISNPSFGFQVSADGSGYTWSVNSREHQITPWSNDPVSDQAGEAFFIQDDDSGAIWCPVAKPVRLPTGTYKARHGWGYSRFEFTAYGIETNLLQYVPISDSIKVSRLTIRNISDRPRHLSVTAYVEWSLGKSRSLVSTYTKTNMDTKTGAMFASNAWVRSFASRVSFLDMSGRQTEWTGDRREFIGRNGTLSNPLALSSKKPFSKATGAGFDPCGALRTKIELPAHSSTEVVIFLGDAASVEEARTLISNYRTCDLYERQNEVRRFWDDLLGSIQVKTPDRAMDIMLNGWLNYQTVVCRIWARSAFYQASGAYGFRDQLQDCMSLVTRRPEMLRQHLLYAAGRQFVEGDVQHWWLPQSGRGVRTRISDDRMWLAYGVARYISVTDDAGILDEMVPFLTGPQLEEGEHDRFFEPSVSDEVATLFEHCARAIDMSLACGSHGLPLIGTGDWNDGMNAVGQHGHGESVWLGWFSLRALQAFMPLAEARNEIERAKKWKEYATSLRQALEENAWDGGWYRRGFFDDGTPFGSAINDECQIDSIAQSWSVISGEAMPERAAQAMESLDRRLVDREEKVAMLLTPPFNHSKNDPGYLKSYPPGIRENGGQYTHATAWTVIAFAMLGDGDRAFELFNIINPVKHASSRAALRRYKVEPYAVAADIYANPQHMGRGGWTWYTGSAGWTQQAGFEYILGIRKHGNVLRLDPSIPKNWPRFEAMLRHGESLYEVVVENPDGVSRRITSAQCDGKVITARPLRVDLVDDGALHRVLIKM